MFGLSRVLIECDEAMFWSINALILLVFVDLQQEDEEMLVPHSDLVEGPQPMEGLEV